MPHHLTEFKYQPHQEYFENTIKSNALLRREIVFGSAHSFTVKYKENVVGLYGVYTDPNDDDTFIAWAIFSKDIKPALLFLAKHIKYQLETLPNMVVKTTALAGFHQSAKFLKLLGFKPVKETLEADGRKHIMFNYKGER